MKEHIITPLVKLINPPGDAISPSIVNDCSEETRMAFGIIHQNADPDLEMRRANSAAQKCVVACFAGYRHLRNNQPEEAAKWFKTASEQGLPDRVETRFALIKLDRG